MSKEVRSNAIKSPLHLGLMCIDANSNLPL